MTKDYETFLDEIVDTFGEDVLTKNEATEVISTGSISLDASLGVGGIPCGKVTEVFGPEGSGKSTLAVTISDNAISMGKKVLYIDVENLLDNYVVEGMLGHKPTEENLLIIHPDTAEDALSIAEKGIERGFGLIVLDSIAALAPSEEKEKELDEASMTLTPRLIAKFLRRNIHGISSNKVAFLCINQVRDTIGTYVKTYSTPGGHALKHFSAVRISLSKGQDITQGSGDTKKVVGINVNFTVKKNKLAPPFRTYMIPIVFGEGIDFYKDFINFARMLGVIKQSGPYYKFEEDTLGKGMNETVEYLKNQKLVLDKIKEKVYNIVSKTKEDEISSEENQTEVIEENE